MSCNSLLTLSTWRWRQTPQVKGSVLQDCPSSSTPATSDASQVWAVTCASDQPVVGSCSPSRAGLICKNGSQLRKSQFTGLLASYKGHNSNSQKAQIRRARFGGRRRRTSMFCPVPYCLRPPMRPRSSPNPVVWDLLHMTID